ncbi:MarR family winged helix-turn-helix transcriptional regulator [Neobacillus dielmonensis]|uniref:MarR family winged helix-turn-helix transcriptional regulator n=1 Tax=Neobacillus dielmonensis TaxID=1347369 RepID=UPI0005AAE26F|nr:winged helix DNA-binding protein [Neobacillus dielmonensis]
MNDKIAQEYIALIPNLFSSFSELNKGSITLTHTQNHVIEFLFTQQRAVNIKDISNGLNITKQQLTTIVSELEAQGYLVKKPDSKDKRAVLVSLTSKGKEIQNKKWSEIYQRFLKNLTKISEEEKRDLAFALHKVNVLLKKMESEE